MFDDNSRYAGLPIAEHLERDGRIIVYVRRRFVPPKESYQVAAVVMMSDSDRLDLIAHRAFGVPTAFWQLADANEAMHPDELIAKPGRRVAVPIPRK